MQKLKSLWGTKKGKLAILASFVVLLIFCCILLLTLIDTTPKEQYKADTNALYTQAAQTVMAEFNQQATQSSSTQQPPTQIIPTVVIPTQTPSQMAKNQFAWNYLTKQNSGGLVVEVSRVVLAEKTTLTNQDFSILSVFDDKPVVGLIVFTITNTTDKILNVYPDQGKIIVGNEQINLIDYMFATFGDDFSGEIYPGVTVIGGLWFGIKRTPLNEIQSIIIAFNAPHDNNFTSVGEDYNFNIDLSIRKNDPLPENLK